MAPPAPEAFAEEVTRYASGSYKRTIPYMQTASKAIVQHAVLNFQPAALA